jgi:hypothetical protein
MVLVLGEGVEVGGVNAIARALPPPADISRGELAVMDKSKDVLG